MLNVQNTDNEKTDNAEINVDEIEQYPIMCTQRTILSIDLYSLRSIWIKQYCQNILNEMYKMRMIGNSQKIKCNSRMNDII